MEVIYNLLVEMTLECEGLARLLSGVASTV